MAQKEIRTSITHPLIINTIEVSNGELGLTFCPGKKQLNAMTGIWDRDLTTDLEAIQRWGADIVISLLEQHEYEELAVPTLPYEFERRFEWINSPIIDKQAPDQQWMGKWPKYQSLVADALLQGKKVLIHCKGGFGRTGTVAAMILIDQGFTCEEAIQTCRKTRELSVETTDQESFLYKYADQF